MIRDAKRLQFLPGWRIFTYVIIAANLLMLSWLIAGVTSADRHKGCGALEAMTCANGTSAGPVITALPIITICVLLNLILGALWLNTRQDKTRPCPECGREGGLGRFRCGHSALSFRDGLHQHSAYSYRQVPPS
jgi:hypothetical protein